MEEEQKRLAEELLGESKKESVAKLFFFGKLDTPRLFPYPQLLPEEEVEVEPLLHKIQDFAEGEIDPIAIDREANIPDKVIQGLGKLGMLGFTLPKEYGGLGQSQKAYALAMQIIGARCASTAVFINAHHSIGVRALQLFGTEEQQKKWLPALARGEKLAAFSLTEPNAGSDAAGVETKAEYLPDQKSYKITGKKQWTTNGSIADVLTVMAKTEDGKVTAFLVTPDMPGFKVTAKALEKVSIRGTKTANLSLDGVVVPEANILGPKGGGLKVCLTVLDFGRVTFGATCTGIAKDVVSRAIRHAKTRHQFKRPLASFSLVKKKIAEISALAYAMEAVTMHAASLLDRKESDFMLETAIVKVFCSESLWKIIYETMQIFGGRSFFTDLPLERFMRDARLNMIGEGSNEVLRAFIGAVGLREVGLSLKAEPIKQMISLLSCPKTPVDSPLGKRFVRLVKHFGRAAVSLLIRFREDVVEKQLLLNRMAETAIALYTVSTVLSKMQLPGTKDLEKQIGQAYCHKALTRAERALSALHKNQDDLFEGLSDEIVAQFKL